MNANRRSCDHLDALHKIRGRIHLREHAGHAVDLELIGIHGKAANRKVIVEGTAACAHGGRHEKRVRQRVHPIVILRDGLVRDVRLMERNIHHILRTEKARPACTAYKTVFIALRAALPFDHNIRERIAGHLLCPLCGMCRPHPTSACCRQRHGKDHLFFRHNRLLSFPSAHRRTAAENIHVRGIESPNVVEPPRPIQ